MFRKQEAIYEPMFKTVFSLSYQNDELEAQSLTLYFQLFFNIYKMCKSFFTVPTTTTNFLSKSFAFQGVVKKKSDTKEKALVTGALMKQVKLFNSEPGRGFRDFAS